MGVDGSISDMPWRLREILEKKGAKLRPIVKVASPKYHLEPNHNEVEVKKAEGGQDASH